jgi:t-SNARE complex subunit (syntaxin)
MVDFLKYKALYNDVKKQNDLIDARILELKDNYTLNETTTSYIDKEINNIKYTSIPLFYMYCVCIILLCVVLLIYKPLDFKMSIIVVILLLLSPFYLIQVELFMYNILVYIYSLLSGIVYKPV